LEFATVDLSSDNGWDDAMAGCEYVLHVASPLSIDGEEADSLISLAREGTLRVLAAAETIVDSGRCLVSFDSTG
jgi:dihydroflavonol-4-reductase